MIDRLQLRGRSVRQPRAPPRCAKGVQYAPSTRTSPNRAEASNWNAPMKVASFLRYFASPTTLPPLASPVRDKLDVSYHSSASQRLGKKGVARQSFEGASMFVQRSIRFCAKRLGICEQWLWAGVLRRQSGSDHCLRC
ncbi:hypothetical protein BDW62DRAFT_35642 [Aspergillus aurantiobrunneus]